LLLCTASITSRIEAIGCKLVRIHIDLVLADKASDRGDLRHAGHGIQLIADEPILDGSQLPEVLAFAFDGVPKDLADGGSVRAENRRHATGEERRDQIHALQNPCAREVEIGAVLEDHVDHREAESRGRTDGLDPCQALEVDDHGVGHLVLDFLRRTPRPVGEHDDLGLRDIRDRVQRIRPDGVDTGRRQEKCESQNEEPVVE
jgi:hypothetical protein